MLAEVIGPADGALSDRIEAALADAFEKGLATDGVIASSEAQRDAMWQLRETIPEANRKVGAISSHDISIPISRIAAFIAEGQEVLSRIDPDIVTNCFGHLGDGNLHYNAFPPKGRTRDEFANRKGEVQRAIYDLVAAYDGSISAEHGIGRFKADDLVHYGDPAKLSAMRAIKAALDPAGIMNPGAVITG